MQRSSLFVGTPDIFNLANFQPYDDQPSSQTKDRATSPTSARSATSTASAFTPRVITPTNIQWANHKPGQPFQEVRDDSFLESLGKEKEKDKKGYIEPPPVSPLDSSELKRWSFYRAALAEFVATALFLYFTLSAVIGASKEAADIGGIGLVGISWSFGGMIFVLVYCTAGISGGHINPAVTFGLMLARKVTINRAVFYMVAQVMGAICGAALVKVSNQEMFEEFGGGANFVHDGYSTGTGLAAEILGTFLLVYTVFSATDPKRNARDSHVPILAPLPIGFAVFTVHLATVPITGTGINPARTFGAAVISSNWQQHWIFWVGPGVGAAIAAIYHKYILRAALFKQLNAYIQHVGVQ